ncbi:tRNA pseudouridine(13) synthase TruD [Vibrio salinus]|uniref:tRNA pseudouridine(13) synthase TruD n=1 Tax=Vibrio salinus TaxID=2899784 RepID=UPI001E54E328|nr:tRNA pseudouridine(13) synthase TruD [Vibrio salinus]MCE0494201.1 tRNA pseudouridine(13) synthase TruD [Vibrio salinus]
MSDILADLAFLCGKPKAKAKIKAKPEDFIVLEKPGFEFSGSGEHLLVKIRKTGENTKFVANELAKSCGVKSRDVSWAGLKDRHAVTEQWLSVYLPDGQTPDFSGFLASHPQVQILDITRHHKKLRPGDLQSNTFNIALTDVSDVDDVIARLKQVKQLGVPNYFGQQRFGNNGNNLSEARRWGKENVRTRNQNKRSMYLSTARSWIFNHIVSKRIETGCFDSFIAGDIALENGEPVLVKADMLDSWNQKVTQNQAVITAAMAGDNALPTEEDALLLEQPVLDSEPDLMKLICGNRMRHDRRNIALYPEELDWQCDDNRVIVNFSLGAGSFATSILRELVEEIPVERDYN